MKPSLLIVIASDPRTSARPAEGIRIAAGVGTWKKIDVSVYLRDAAVLALTEFPDELKEEDNYTRYFPIVGEFGRPIYVQKGAPLLQDLGQATLPYEEIDDNQLADLASRHQYTLRF